ncbi:MAG: hypothetical protein ACOX9C_01630 [Kiritimatiellia bacterium]|jgi:hypothetical protein
MVISYAPYGRMANRLILASNWIAAAEEVGVRYAHLSFGYYGRYFENLRGRPFLLYTPEHRSAAPTKRLVGRLAPSKHEKSTGAVLNPLQPPLVERLASTLVLFTRDWRFRCPEAVRKHRDKIRSFFRPAEECKTANARFMEEARGGVDCLVGVHMRRTDYAIFKDGKWFYDDATYYDLMKKTAALDKGRTRFVVCSDAAIDTSAFGELDVIKGPNHEFGDCLCLSACDKIIGPPSTYSKWAAFAGGVPQLVISDPSKPVTDASFIIPHDL